MIQEMFIKIHEFIDIIDVYFIDFFMELYIVYYLQYLDYKQKLQVKDT